MEVKEVGGRESTLGFSRQIMYGHAEELIRIPSKAKPQDQHTWEFMLTLDVGGSVFWGRWSVVSYVLHFFADAAWTAV